EEPLTDDYPGVLEYRRNLADTHGQFGDLLREQGKLEQAEEQFSKAVAVRVKMAADRATRARFRAAVMALEQRDCPATAVFSAGELMVLGTAPQGETVQVATQGQDMVVLDGQQEIFRQTASTVTKLSVTTGAGADNVTIHLVETGNVLAQSLQVQIDTGAGNDNVSC